MNFVVTTEYNRIADWMLLIIAMKLIQYPSIQLMRLSTCSQCLKYQTYILMLQQRKPDKHNCCIALQTGNSVWTGLRLTSQNWWFLIHVNSTRATQIHYFWLVFCLCEEQPACVSPACEGLFPGWVEVHLQEKHFNCIHVKYLLTWALFVGIS